MAVDWITADAAAVETGLDLSDNELERAAIEVYDLMRWTPAFGVDIAGDSDRDVMQRSALGRAIAWQAAYRRTNDPLADLGGRELSSVSVGSYSESYKDGSGSVPLYAKRTRSLLAAAGLLGLTGSSSRGNGRRGPEFIPVI